MLVVKEFINMVHTQYGYPVRYFWSDGETSPGNDFDDMLASYGISSDRSSPYTPAHNGSAERAGGVIIAVARRIRIEARLPSSLWLEIY
jgi:hypothetical protein